MIFGIIPLYKLRNAGTSNHYQFAPKNWFWARFNTICKRMQEHRTFITSLLKINFGPNFRLNPRNAGTLNVCQFAPKNGFWAKIHITSQGMQEHRTFINSLLKIYFGPNFTLQAKDCGKIETLSVRFLEFIFGLIQQYKSRNAG